MLQWTLLSLFVGVVVGGLLYQRYRRWRQPGAVEDLLINPRAIQTRSLYELPRLLRLLRRARELDNVWESLDVPRTRLRLLEPLVDRGCNGPQAMRWLAELLGMKEAAQSEVYEALPGLWFMNISLPDPEGLRGHALVFLGLDLELIHADGEHSDDEVRRRLEVLVESQSSRFEDPYLLLCRHRDDISVDLLPHKPRHNGLVIGVNELRTLLWARAPARTLAGYLVTRGLDTTLSPYRTAGEVEDANMFFGRERLLGELLRQPRHLLIGPRRIGKSSLLRRVAEQLDDGEPSREVIYLDLTMVEDPWIAGRHLADKLGIRVPENAHRDTLFVDLLRGRYADGRRKGVLLLDEFDGLASYDAEHRRRLVSCMRTLQAEGVCSFVLTGFDFLHREYLDQASPLYNFATVHVLGPLASQAARDLVLEPLRRIGVRFESDDLVADIVRVTGGYPSIVQTFCAELLDNLRSTDLCVSAGDVDRASRSPAVLGHIEEGFRMNASSEARVAMFGMLDHDHFGVGDIASALERYVDREVPYRVAEEIVRQLVIGGFIIERGGDARQKYEWSIPLLREALEKDAHAVTRLAAELRGKSEAWLAAGPLAP
ncbi:AAA family ATPase [Haliangium sp.]|uniref:nSTAND1 domain-containing NTPase n=1 Tax=Haliangium sp. TaxID=2663208 RepID=UPI003D0AEC95